MDAPPRGVSPGGAAGPCRQAVPSKIHVSLRQTSPICLGAPPNSTTSPVGG